MLPLRPAVDAHGMSEVDARAAVITLHRLDASPAPTEANGPLSTA